MSHEIKESGAGWICECGTWGWTDKQREFHREMTERIPTRAEIAVDEAWERNR